MRRIRMDAPAVVGLPAAGVLYAVFLGLPCVDFGHGTLDSDPVPGWRLVETLPRLVAQSGREVKAGSADQAALGILGWFALVLIPNLLLWAGLLGLLLHFRHTAWVAASAALVTAQYWLVLTDHRGLHVRVGVVFWLASMAVVLVAGVFRALRTSRRVLS
jgi:hypothetical protein